MIQGKEPINIMTMVDKKEIERKEKFRQVCLKLKQLKDMGMSNDQILDVIMKMNLPCSLHLAITGNFTEIVTLGRIKTKQERILDKVKYGK